MKKVLVLLMVVFAASFSMAQSEMVKLVWDANTETDLAGYKMYWGDVSGSYGTPVDVGLVTEHPLDLSEWTDGVYYFAVTAYDNRGNESGYSNEVSYEVDHTAPTPPVGCRILKIP